MLAWLPIDALESDVPALLADAAWVAQEKADGVHVIVTVDAGAVSATNRVDGVYRLPAEIAAAAAVLSPAGSSVGRVVIDCELLQVAKRLVIFDLFELGAISLIDESYSVRLAALERIGEALEEPLRVIRSAAGEAEKVALVSALTAEQAEGVIFKRLDAPYRPGRSRAGGSMLRWKFRKSADLIVCRRPRGRPRQLRPFRPGRRRGARARRRRQREYAGSGLGSPPSS